MKKLLLLTVVAALPLGLMAQDDDMYFVPTKENVAKETKNYGMPKKTYYSGSNRSVDEYNRSAWSSVVPIDSAGNDIIDFSAVRGVYPDSTVAYENDYKYTKRLSRFDGYTSTSEAYWDGYRDGRWSRPGITPAITLGMIPGIGTTLGTMVTMVVTMATTVVGILPGIMEVTIVLGDIGDGTVRDTTLVLTIVRAEQAGSIQAVRQYGSQKLWQWTL